MSILPVLVAAINGVLPYSSSGSIFAPCFMSDCTISALPHSAATYRGVYPATCLSISIPAAMNLFVYFTLNCSSFSFISIANNNVNPLSFNPFTGMFLASSLSTIPSLSSSMSFVNIIAAAPDSISSTFISSSNPTKYSTISKLSNSHAISMALKSFVVLA